MKKVFIDTNVLIDFILEREGAKNAADILQLGEEKKIRTAASLLTMANTAYIIRKGRTQTELYALLTDLSDMIEILPMDERQFKDALDRPASDFEDVLQYECARLMDAMSLSHATAGISRSPKSLYYPLPSFSAKCFDYGLSTLND